MTTSRASDRDTAIAVSSNGSRSLQPTNEALAFLRCSGFSEIETVKNAYAQFVAQVGAGGA